MKERYERNIGAINQAEQNLLAGKRVIIAGCGGLGCYAAEFLARLGIGHLSLIDGDVFMSSNLNRQLYSLETNLGESKTLEAKKRLLKIRADLSIDTHDLLLDNENAAALLNGHDVVIDALDNIKTRLLLEKTASNLGIPLIHGAVEGWNAQVTVVVPGDFTLAKFYPLDKEFERPSVLSFAPAFCASIQAAEAVKVLLGIENNLRRKLLTIDLLSNSFEIVDLAQ